MKLVVFCFIVLITRLASSLPLAADTTGADNALTAGAAQSPQQAAEASDPQAQSPTGGDAQSSAAAATSAGGDAQAPLSPNTLAAGGLSAMGLSTDNGAAVAAADGITMEKLYPGIDLDNLVKPYGQPEDQTMDVPPVELPPVEEEREGDNRHFLQIYPEISKQQEVVSNKLINTYSTQRKSITVRSNNTVAYLKTLNVNTNYVTNVQRVNHPKQEIRTLTFIQNRYVPKLLVKHTRTDRINELPPKEFVVPPVVEESTSQLPPIIETVDIAREDYDPNVRASNAEAAAGAGGAATNAASTASAAAASAESGQQQSAEQQLAAAFVPGAAAPGEAAQSDQQQQAQSAGASTNEQDLARARRALKALVASKLKQRNSL